MCLPYICVSGLGQVPKPLRLGHVSPSAHDQAKSVELEGTMTKNESHMAVRQNLEP